MLQLITGASASGKSAYAESVATSMISSDEKLIYIATMQPFDTECERRIARHREMRRDKGFTTIECYTSLETVQIPENSVVLLECMSNLLANEIYSKSGAGEQFCAKKILDGVKNLIYRAKSVIIVSNEVFTAGDYDEETQKYIAKLGEINCALADISDTVVEVVFGIKIVHKGVV